MTGVDGRRPAWDTRYVVPGLGCLLLVGTLLTWVALGRLPVTTQVALGLSAVVSGAIVGVGVWLVSGRSPLGPETGARIGLWALGWATVFLAIVLPIVFADGIAPLPEILNGVSIGVTVGAGMGVLVGTIEARSIQRAREAERVRSQIDRTQAERERLERLNSILRHEILNAVTIIRGYSERTRTEMPSHSGLDESLTTIEEQADRIAGTINDIRHVLKSATTDVELQPMALDWVLENEVRHLRAVAPGVDVTMDLDDGLVVAGDEMLPRVFTTLLDNAVEHNDSAAPKVSVRGARTPDGIIVQITDNGPGIPPGIRDELFVRGKGDPGLGLYLISSLLDRFDGSLTLTDTGPHGTTFTVTLPDNRTAVPEPAPDPHPLVHASPVPSVAGGVRPVESVSD